MSRTFRIGALYSRGPHFPRVLQKLREQHPGAQITAIIPPEYPRDALEGLADAVVVTGQNAQMGGHWKTAFAVLAQIRAGKYDHFVVMFDSLKLRLLAAGSGAASRFCHSVDGRIIPLSRNPLPALLRACARSVRGHIVYAYIRWVVYHRPVEKSQGAGEKKENVVKGIGRI